MLSAMLPAMLSAMLPAKRRLNSNSPMRLVTRLGLSIGIGCYTDGFGIVAFDKASCAAGYKTGYTTGYTNSVDRW